MKRWVAVALVLATAPGADAAQELPASPAWTVIPENELRARFDVLWAVSDVHGRLEELDDLLLAARLVLRDGEGRIHWNPAARRQLFVAAGDFIDGRPDGVGVVLRLDRLAKEASTADSRVLAVLGNHEAALLADPAGAGHGLLKSARRLKKELDLPPRAGGADLLESDFGRFLRGLPAAAFVGPWLFAHAGDLGGDDDAASGGAALSALDSLWARTNRYPALLSPRSIVSYHGWWKHPGRRARLRARLRELGLAGVVFGHDPDALGIAGIGVDAEGSMIKLDTGLKTQRSRGQLLRCDLSRGAGLGGAFRALTPSGRLEALPIGR